jgi:hypothetical protein
MMRFWNNLKLVRSKARDWKAKKLKTFGSNKSKGSIQDM